MFFYELENMAFNSENIEHKMAVNISRYRVGSTVLISSNALCTVFGNTKKVRNV